MNLYLYFPFHNKYVKWNLELEVHLIHLCIDYL